MASNRKPINLALQGGGAHGAFTWGVCDRLLESEGIAINAITATSAGAMNGAVLAYGMHLGGDQGARDKLDEYWHEVSKLKNAFDIPLAAQVPFLTAFNDFWSHQMMSTAVQTFSPYQLNPLNLNPLRDLLERVVDFEELQCCSAIKLFISATNVRTGKVKVFKQDEVCIDAVMASTTLPHLYQAVEIDGEAYWDGGYMGNPSLWPLFYETEVQDLLVVHINPLEREEVPTTVAGIENRLNEITFNSALIKEMRAIAFVQKLLHEGWLKDEYRDKLSDIRYHSIRADKVLKDYPLPTKYKTDIGFLSELKEVGRESAETWIQENYDEVGKEQSCSLRNEFLQG
ncbi:MAG: patatin-like phospholipase family protein [Pseudomonadota bacterium]